MFDRRLITYFDWWLLLVILLLGGIGLLTLHSAVTAGFTALDKSIYYKQWVWYGAGCIVMVISFLFNYKLLDQYSHAIYTLGILLLISVLIFGKVISGSQRWLVFGPVSLQPSEPIKIAVIIVLAGYYAKHATTRGLSFRDLIRPIILVAIPFVLIVRQPDLGTAMVVALIAVTITVFIKIERRCFLVLLTCGTVLIPLVWFALKPYQKQRILTFLNPDLDPLGAGYHIIQSKIAIGSGMFVGKGYTKGTQNALAFLPEQHTDFIFSVLSEEWGLLGSTLVVVLFLLLIFWGLSIAIKCRDPFGSILAVGIVAMIFWEAFINIGMVMGLMPVVGVPLPFISYGGSSTITIMSAMGLLLNISMRHFMVE